MGRGEGRRGAELETVIIDTTRPQELARFYAEGLELGPWDELPGHLGQRVGAVYLGFDAVAAAPAGRGAVHAWFTVDDLEATFERFRSRGAEVRYAPTRKAWGGYLACVLDPDGNLVGLSQRQP